MKREHITIDVNRLLSIHGRFHKERVTEGKDFLPPLKKKKHLNPLSVPYHNVEAIFIKMSV